MNGYLHAKGDNPYENLALEEFLLRHVEPGQTILYLWQNRHTVVIGRNQNCWKECRVTGLEEDGGFLARRLSGGGAVYHDLGNLNYTFVTRKENYDIPRQTGVILQAVQAFGIPAEKSGRNDLTVDGRKFSGNAYYETSAGCYQHGTLLLNADGGRMAQFLTVSREKLKSKSVDSVRSRVCNLTEYVPGLSVEAMENALIGAFLQCYGQGAPLESGLFDQEELAALERKYASSQWKYGRSFPFEYELERRFSWGEIQLQLQIREGKIYDCQLYSDALEADFLEGLRPMLTGCAFEGPAIRQALKRRGTEQQRLILADVEGLLLDSM